MALRVHRKEIPDDFIGLFFINVEGTVIEYFAERRFFDAGISQSPWGIYSPD